MCASLLFGISFSYLKHSLTPETSETQQQEEGVLYNKKTPANCGISFVFDEQSACLIYLDFKGGCINVIDIPQFDKNISFYNGYSNDFQVYTKEGFVEGIVDRIGGIDLELDGETLRLTGLQVADYFCQNDTHEKRQKIIAQIFEKFSKNDFAKEDFVYIIENSKSNLNFIDCIYWLDYLKDMSQNVNFVNF